MNSPSNLPARIAVSLIGADVCFFRDLVLSPNLATVRSIASLALMPHLSAFVYDSCEYVRHVAPNAAAVLDSHHELLQMSRLRLKILDDDRRSFARLLTDAEELAKLKSSWFLGSHKGFLAPLKNLIQPDLGVFLWGKELVCTTHVAFLNMGISRDTLAASGITLDTLGPFMRSTTESFGRYMSFLLRELGLRVDPSALPAVASEAVHYRDVKSKAFYEKVSRRFAPRAQGASLLLTSILSLVNAARVLVPRIAGENFIASFKARFVTLFHAASSLQHVLAQHGRAQLLQPDAARLLQDVLANRSVKLVLRSNRLRNNLVHYKVHPRTATGLSPHLPLCGLVEADARGCSLATMALEVGHGLDQMSANLRLLLPAISPEGVL